MKIRAVLVSVTLLLLGIYMAAMAGISKTEVDKTDFVRQNAIVKEIEKRMQEGGEVPEAAGYMIVLTTSDEYEKKLYEAYASDATVMDVTRDNQMIGKVIFPQEKSKEERLRVRLTQSITVITMSVLGIFYLLVFYIYRQFIKPFHTLQRFATEISEGNFEFSLHMEKSNYFGAFTESFDLMRDELLKAKQGEYEASRSKKELVASLSHDIKTPVATIKANCELLEAMVGEEAVQRKLSIIHSKANVINELIDNMFHATLEEMQMLKVNPAETESAAIKPMFEEVNHYGLIEFAQEIPDCLVLVDVLRLGQVIDNIISNSYKYANTKILVSSEIKSHFLCITVRDYGPGVREEEIAFLFEKFYRGQNAGNLSGSGLGLYIGKQFMTRMKGDLICFNDHGFVVTLSIPLV